MFPYTEKYTESESDIQNNNFFYNIGPKCQNTFDFWDVFGKFPKTENVQNPNVYFVLCINSIIPLLYFL